MDAARRHLLGAHRDPETLRRIARRSPEDAWSAPAKGIVRTTRLVVSRPGENPRRASSFTIADVVRDGAVVWIRRRNAVDWLVECRDEADAGRLAAEIRDVADV